MSLEDRTLRRPIIINTDDPRIGTIDSTMQFDVFGEPIRNTLNELVFDHWVRPGISRVGSNPQLAEHILDGDPTTFWEPDPRDPIEQWWIEVGSGASRARGAAQNSSLSMKNSAIPFCSLSCCCRAGRARCCTSRIAALASNCSFRRTRPIPLSANTFLQASTPAPNYLRPPGGQR